MELLRDNYSQKYIFWDLETCNLSLLDSNLPWSIAYIVYQNGKILEKHNHYIKWENLPISKDAARITRFNKEEYEQKAEDPVQVLNKFETYLNDKTIICGYHNGTNFDSYVLKIWREALLRKNDYSYMDTAIDTNCIAKAIKKGVKRIKPEERKMMMFRFGNYVEKGLKTNLTALGKEFGIQADFNNAHNALFDVEMCINIWNKQKFLIEI